MKLRADRTEFVDAVQWAARFVAARAALPALSGIMLTAADGRLTCSATDLELAAEGSIPVQIDEPGRVLLPGRLLGLLVARLPDAPVELTGNADQVELTCGRATFHVHGMKVDDFPQLPQPDPDGQSGVVRSDAFARLVGQVARAAATEDASPVLTGVLLEAADGTLTAAATDRFRMAMRTIPWEQAVSGESLVPARALQEAAKAASEAGGTVSIVLEEQQVSFLLGDKRLVSRLIPGNFPPVRTLLPDAHDSTVVVDRADLIEALQRVAIVAQGRTNSPVTLTFEDGAVDLRANNQEVGDAAEALPADITGEGPVIAFNPTLLLAGLEATGTDRIRIELRDGTRPAVIRPEVSPDDEGPGDDFVYLLMPMRT